MPDLLTVEEAAAVLRIGRTKAYALAREWRTTGGRSGLPVVDLGHVLRVPRAALERLVGAEVRTPVVARAASRPSSKLVSPKATRRTPKRSANRSPSTVTELEPRRSRRSRSSSTQASLFDPPPDTAR